MADAALNQPYLIGAFFENDAGPISGVADMVVTVVNRGTGTTISSGAASESPAGSGYYQYLIPANVLTSPGRLQVTFSSALNQLYDTGFIRLGDIPSWARTKRDVRLMIARLLDGEYGGWDMEASSGSTTTAVLPDLNFGGDLEYAGMWARFSDGQNRLKTRRVTNYDSDTLTITFAPALPAAVANGHRVELYRTNPDRIDEHIHSCYAAMDDVFTEPYVDRSLTTDGSTTEYSMPPDVRRIDRIGLAKSGVFAGWLPQQWWEMRGNRLVSIGGILSVGGQADPFRWGATAFQALPSGYELWVEGRVSIDPPLYDDGFVDIAPDYVVAQCHYRMAMMRPTMAQLWPFLKRIADTERKKALSNSTGIGVR